MEKEKQLNSQNRCDTGIHTCQFLTTNLFVLLQISIVQSCKHYIPVFVSMIHIWPKSKENGNSSVFRSPNEHSALVIILIFQTFYFLAIDFVHVFSNSHFWHQTTSDFNQTWYKHRPYSQFSGPNFSSWWRHRVSRDVTLKVHFLEPYIYRSTCPIGLNLGMLIDRYVL